MTNIDVLGAGSSLDEPLIAEGEIILLGPNGGLAVQVIAVREGKAWVRDLDHDRDGVVDLDGLRAAELGAAGGLQ